MPFWESIKTNHFILEVIKTGYRIPFVSTPTRCYLKNNQSAIVHRSFVENAIFELVHTFAVIEVPFIPHVVSPLSVSVNSSGKKRLILDLRHVNQYVWKDKVKFEDWRVLRTFVSKGGFLFGFDLKSGYHHVEIFQPHQTFLGFSWSFTGVIKHFCFTVLPFGLTSAHIFLPSFYVP